MAKQNAPRCVTSVLKKMIEKPEPPERVKSVFDEISVHFDSWLETLQGKVYGFVTWEHVKHYLPADRSASILDAGGGTGRWSLPLAGMGYRVTLCDISQGMLRQAETKIKREGLADKITIREEDLTGLTFADASFDFVLCEDGPMSIADSEKVMGELARVVKPGGSVWASVLGRHPLALAHLPNDPEKALKLCRSELHFAPYKGIQKSRVFTPDELEDLFQHGGLRVLKVYGNRIAVRLLPEERRVMTDFDDAVFSHLSSVELHLSEDPSVLGMAEYLQIAGQKPA